MNMMQSYKIVHSSSCRSKEKRRIIRSRNVACILSLTIASMFVSQQWSYQRNRNVRSIFVVDNKQELYKVEAVVIVHLQYAYQASAWTAFLQSCMVEGVILRCWRSRCKVLQINKITAGTITGSVALSSNADIGIVF